MPIFKAIFPPLDLAFIFWKKVSEEKNVKSLRISFRIFQNCTGSGEF